MLVSGGQINGDIVVSITAIKKQTQTGRPPSHQLLLTSLSRQKNIGYFWIIINVFFFTESHTPTDREENHHPVELLFSIIV